VIWCEGNPGHARYARVSNIALLGEQVTGGHEIVVRQSSQSVGFLNHYGVIALQTIRHRAMPVHGRLRRDAHKYIPRK